MASEKEVTQSASKRSSLRPENLDAATISSFSKACRELHEDALKAYTPEDEMAHLRFIVRVANGFLFVGCLTAGICVNPVSAMCLSLYIVARWAIIGHHCCHGAYTKLDKTGAYGRGQFGLGLRGRVMDWMDWWSTELWSFEHNKLHHYVLNEDRDPDLVEKNVAETTVYFWGSVENNIIPRAVRYILAIAVFFSWKWFYYVPNLVKEKKLTDKTFPVAMKQHGLNLVVLMHLLFAGRPPAHVIKNAGLDPAKEPKHYVFWWRFAFDLICTEIPYIFTWFVCLPLAWWFLGGVGAAKNTAANMVIAELLTNLHGASIIIPNHCGCDLYRFSASVPTHSADFYVRAVLASANYSTGTDLIDFLHCWLNYQVEHHMYPELSLLQVRYLQPKVKAACESHGIRYIQEPLLVRIKKTLTLMVDATKHEGPHMRQLGKDSKCLVR